MSDLQPYICTFEGCSTQMFQSRHEWFQHELDNHRKEWHCYLCSNEIVYSSAAQLQSHLRLEHSDHRRQETSAIVALCEKPLESIPLSACPFCTWYPWDPYKILGVDPSDRHSTCVGTRTTGHRCGWWLRVNDQFSHRQIDAIVKTLESMSRIHPSKIADETLCSLAQDTLCRYHKTQATAICHQWKQNIRDYLHKHSEWDFDVHHVRGLKPPPELAPTVMVSSLDFERHVAHHLEQLALFALPPPIKEPSAAASNQAATSVKSG